LVAPTLSMFSRMLKLGSLPLPLALPPSLLLPPKGRATPRAAWWCHAGAAAAAA